MYNKLIDNPLLYNNMDCLAIYLLINSNSNLLFVFKFIINTVSANFTRSCIKSIYKLNRYDTPNRLF